MICNKKTKPKMSILLSADSEGRHPASALLDLIINRRNNSSTRSVGTKFEILSRITYHRLDD